MRIPIAAAAVTVLALPGDGAAGSGLARPTLPGIRPLGMGNAFVAVVDDRNALHDNPAGLGRLDRLRVSGAGVYAGVDNEFFGMVDFIRDNEEKFTNFDAVDQEFYDELAAYDDKWTAFDASAHFDVTRPGFGAGFFTVGRLQFKVDRGVYEPRVSANVYDDIVGLVGGSRGFVANTLHVGATLKAVWRRDTSRELTAREVADFEPDSVLSDLEKARGGVSTDVGFLYRPAGASWTAGAVFRDLVGTIGGEDIDTALDLGLSWQPVREGRVVQAVTLAVDRRDVFGGQPFGSGMHVGAEVRLPVVSGRVGFNQGYPTAGLTVHAPVFALDYAFFGRELGAFPGSEGQYLHAVEARLGF